MTKQKRTLRRRSCESRRPVIADEDSKPLNERQELFARYYAGLEIPDAMSAYKKAGYTGNGEAARSSAHEILYRPNVHARIEELRKERMTRLEADGDEVVRRLLLLASSNILDYLDYDNVNLSLKTSDDLTREQAYCISEVKEIIHSNGGRAVSFKLHDKKQSLALLAQHFGLLDGSGSTRDPLQAAREFRDHLDELLGSVPSKPIHKEGEDG